MFPHPHLRVGSDQTLFLMLLTTFATAAIFVLTYAGVLLGRIPGLRLDRSGIALSGAALMFDGGQGGVPIGASPSIGITSAGEY